MMTAREYYADKDGLFVTGLIDGRRATIFIARSGASVRADKLDSIVERGVNRLLGWSPLDQAQADEEQRNKAME